MNTFWIGLALAIGVLIGVVGLIYLAFRVWMNPND